MPRPITFALASMLAIGFMALSPASAETARLSYAELNLNSEAGARALERRIRFAARQACGFRRGPMDLYERAEIRRCIRSAIDESVSDVNRQRATL